MIDDSHLAGRPKNKPAEAPQGAETGPPVLFIDRDGTLVQEPPDEQVDALDKVVFYPGALTYLGKLARETDYRLVLVSNQDGLGTERYPREKFEKVHAHIMGTFAGEGVHFDEECIDSSTAADPAPTRKPGTAMLSHYLHGRYDLARSAVIGDRHSDVALARNLGCRAIFLGAEAPEADLATPDWAQVYRFLKDQYHRAEVTRQTRETEVRVALQLRGEGRTEVATGLGFLDHMLAQLGRHSGMDLTVKARGDLQVDEHHTLEDVALTLGEALRKALGSKRGLERYGYCLPMDDVQAQVALDLGGRPWFQWEVAPFKREYLGDVPNELWPHFFKSFSDAGKLNLHVSATEGNEHHRIEAVFKATARALKMALREDETHLLPSTKGTLA